MSAGKSNHLFPCLRPKFLKQPRLQKRAKALTFEEEAEQWFATHERKWKNPKHKKQIEGDLRRLAFPKIGRLSVSEIDTGQVLRAVEPIWVRIDLTEPFRGARVTA
jgi:hypothetical protein